MRSTVEDVPWIDVRGFNPQNLGSCLMLLAAQARLARAFPGCRLSVGLSNGDLGLSLRHRARFDTWGRWPERWRHLPVAWAGAWIPPLAQRALHVTTDRDFKAVIDISGFAYGDFWGAEKLQRRLGRELPQWRRRGQKLLLLPQAFGPFEKPELAAGMREVLEAADLVCPRDRVSASYLARLRGSAQKLDQFPDFTHEVPALRRPWYPAPNTYFCLIPNSKLVAGRSSDDGERYVRFFVDSAARFSRELGVPPLLLCFGGREDEQLMRALRDRIRPRPRTIRATDPRYAKGVIAGAAAVVSSRFHAILSALGSAVPTLALGWSHKYGEAMTEYESAAYSLSLGDPSITETLRAFTAELENGALQKRLRAAGEKQRAATERMWQKVIACIGEAS
jgi:colanic acid/amylovoran biosynthesis protein